MKRIVVVLAASAVMVLVASQVTASSGGAAISRGVVGAPIVSITTFPDASIAGPVEFTTGQDGALWFVNQDNSSIGRITTRGSVSNFTDPRILWPRGIAAGRDGALWFTIWGNNAIGRITTKGVVTTFADASVMNPESIAAGPDGALWFTNEYGNSIGRITTRGVISSYTGTGISEPMFITAGPDGALWFTNIGNNSIGRITTRGVVSNITDPSISTPWRIALGPDRALWFTNRSNNSVGRITTKGVVENFTDPSIGNPDGITTGPDGALWFTNNPAGGPSLGRITSDGVVSNYDARIGGSGIAGITVGPDNALWFGYPTAAARATVLSPLQAVGALIDLVESYNLGRLGIVLNFKLHVVKGMLIADKPERACRGIGSFVEQVKAESNKGLTSAQASELTARAGQIGTSIGCPVHCEAPPTDAIAWWNGNGNANDSVNGYDGTLVDGSYSAGISGDAFALDGIDDYVQVPDAPAWNFGANDFSISLWANFADASRSQAVLAHDEGGGETSKWMFWLDQGQLHFHMNSPTLGPTDAVMTQWQPTLGQWYHLAVTRTGVTFTIYINGAPVATGANSNPVPNASTPLTIGWGEGPFYFNGLLDEVQIFNRALSAAEIANVYTAGVPGACQ